MVRSILPAVALAALTACGGDNATAPGPAPASSLQTLGLGAETKRYTAEVFVRGTTAYTTTWSTRNGVAGNKVNIWDVSGTTPLLVDSLLISGMNGRAVSTLGDVAVSDDGSLLVVATEFFGSIAIYNLANPRKPALITQFHTPDTENGVHTAEIGRVNGKLYGFLAIDPSGTAPARLVTVDLSDPTNPREVFTRVIGNPYVHDTFVRDGILFLALWNDGIQIWDIGGGGKGGTPETPVVLGAVQTVGGQAHNIWWYKDASGNKRYAFVGQEGAGTVGSTSSGDIHVVDVSDLTKPKEVAFFHVNGAGTHNFSMDETNGVLYAAYYNAGVQALDVRGDLGTCSGSQQNVTVNGSTSITRCDLDLMGRRISAGLTGGSPGVYVWGVQYVNGRVYASDMLNGIWALSAAK
jgi:hypothetical protein